MMDRRTDGRTDRRTDARGKTICLPTLSGGDIMMGKSIRQIWVKNELTSNLSNRFMFESCDGDSLAADTAVEIQGQYKTEAHGAGLIWAVLVMHIEI